MPILLGVLGFRQAGGGTTTLLATGLVAVVDPAPAVATVSDDAIVAVVT